MIKIPVSSQQRPAKRGDAACVRRGAGGGAAAAGRRVGGAQSGRGDALLPGSPGGSAQLDCGARGPADVGLCGPADVGLRGLAAKSL